MPVETLRGFSIAYNTGIIYNDELMSLMTLIANGLGIYTAFHEIAQLNIARKLYKKGYHDIVLEDSLGWRKGEIDIVAQKGNKTYIWEVKPIVASPYK